MMYERDWEWVEQLQTNEPTVNPRIKYLVNKIETPYSAKLNWSKCHRSIFSESKNCLIRRDPDYETQQKINSVGDSCEAPEVETQVSSGNPEI